MQPEDYHGQTDPPDPIGAAAPSLHPIYSRPQGYVGPAPQAIENEIVNTTGRHEAPPAEVEEMRWHWGAFLSGWIWCFFNGLPAWGVVILAIWIALAAVIWPSGDVNVLVAIPLAIFALALHTYLGLNGHQLAWQNRRFPSGFPQFQSVQRAWSTWSMWVFVITAPIAILVLELPHPPSAAAPAAAPAAVDAALPNQPADMAGNSNPIQSADTPTGNQPAATSPPADQTATAAGPPLPVVGTAGQPATTPSSLPTDNTAPAQPAPTVPTENPTSPPVPGPSQPAPLAAPPASAVSTPPTSQPAQPAPAPVADTSAAPAGQPDTSAPTPSGDSQN